MALTTIRPSMLRHFRAPAQVPGSCTISTLISRKLSSFPPDQSTGSSRFRQRSIRMMPAVPFHSSAKRSILPPLPREVPKVLRPKPLLIQLVRTDRWHRSVHFNQVKAG